MQNNAHAETKAKRLKRFKDNPPTEAIETLLNSIDNYFNNEIVLTPDNHQTSLLFLGIHASILTISEAFFDMNPKDSYKHFLELFIDGKEEHLKFSIIADIIHDWRNILAHQWLGSLGHEIGYDYEMTLGWKQEDGRTIINPKIYCNQYLQAFATGGRIWDYETILKAEVLETAKQRIIKKFESA